MYAVVRINEPDPQRLRAAQQQLHQFDQQHTTQAGYRGTLIIDLGGRHLVVNVWDSEQQAAAARQALSPTVKRVLNPVLAQPSRLLGAGPVLGLDLQPTP